MKMEAKLREYRDWQKQHPEWELCCDIANCEELPKRERMSWIGSYRDAAKDAFEEFAVKRCKVRTAVLCPDMQLREVMDWPHGFCMLVFKTKRRSGKILRKGAK
jgi:hypothetical protein